MTRATELLNLAEGALRIVNADGYPLETRLAHAKSALGYVEELDRLLRDNSGRSEGVGVGIGANTGIYYETGKRREKRVWEHGHSEGSEGQSKVPTDLLMGTEPPETLAAWLDDLSDAFEGEPNNNAWNLQKIADRLRAPVGESEERQLIRELVDFIATPINWKLWRRARDYLAKTKSPCPVSQAEGT